MNKKLVTMSVLVAVLGLIAMAPLAYAESKGEGPDDAGYQKAEGKGFFKELNLTEEQKAKVKANREAQKEKSKAVREQLKTKMQALHEEIAKPVSDRAKIDSAVAEINTLKGQLFAQHIEGVLSLKEVLTPEQFTKMQEHRKERFKEKQGGWMKHRGEKGGE